MSQEAEQIVLQKTKAYFLENKKRFELLHAILTKKYKLSLRLLEFAVQHAERVTQDINLHALAIEMLSLYGKRKLDAFKRHRAFILEGYGMRVESNLAQLRFLKFGHRIGVIQKLLTDTRLIDKLDDQMNAGSTKKSTETAVGIFNPSGYHFFAPLNPTKLAKPVSSARCFQ